MFRLILALTFLLWSGVGRAAETDGAETADVPQYASGMLRLEELPPVPVQRVGSVPAKLGGETATMGGADPASIAEGWNSLSGPTSAWVLGGELKEKPLDHPIAFSAAAEADAGNSFFRRFLANLSLAGLDKALYTFGGIGADGRPTADVLKNTYDGQNAKIVQEKIGELPQPLAFAAAVELKQKVYIVGGVTSIEPLEINGSTFVIDVSRLADPALGFHFERKAGRPLIAPAAVRQYTNLFYVFGGWQEGEGESLVPSSAAWGVLPKQTKLIWQNRRPAPIPLGLTGASPLGQSQIFVIGQGDPPSVAGLADIFTALPRQSKSEAYTYHVALNRWVRFPDLHRLKKEDGGVEPEPIASPFVSPLLVPKGDKQVVALGSLTPPDPAGVPAGVFSIDDPQKKFSWPDYLAIGVYVLVLIFIAWWHSRQEDTADFFVGGRRIPFWAVAVSAYATGTSAISFMALPAMSYMENLVFLVTPVLQAVSIVAVICPVVVLLRRLEITTMYEYLNQRFNRLVQWASSLAQLAFLIGGRMSVILFLPALALSQVTGVDVRYSIILMGIVATIYTVFGGIKAVIWTDVLQTVVMVGGATACLIVMIVTTPGGLGGYVDVCAGNGKFEVFDFSWDLTLAVFWVFLIEGSFRGFVAISEQPTMQRIFSTRTSADARKSVILFALLGVPGAMLFYGLGTALFAFYHSQPELVSPTLRNDAIFPLYIVQQLPAGVAGTIVAALFAASMSTLDSATNTSSALVVKDFYKPLWPHASEKLQLITGRVATVVVGVLATLIALWMAAQELPSLFRLFMKLAGILGGGMPGVILLGLLTRRANSFGVLVGLIVSSIVMLLLPFSFVSAFLYVPVAITVSFVVGYLASLAAPRPGNLSGLTVWTTRNEARSSAPETAVEG